MRKFYLIIFLLFLLFTSVNVVLAQQDKIPKDQINFTPWTTDLFTNLSATDRDWPNTNSNVGNILLNNTSTVTGNILAVFDESDHLRVVDNLNTYSAGNIVGFRGKTNTITGVTIEISTWLGATKVNSREFKDGLLTTIQDYTLVTTGDYNAVQIKISGSLTASFDAQYAIVKAFDPDESFACNTPVLIKEQFHTFEIAPSLTQFLGVSTGNQFSNILNPNNNSGFTYASLLSGGVQLGVVDQIYEYVDPHFVGFDITTNSLLDVSALNSMEIRTYLNGTLQETVNMATQLVGITVIGGNTKRIGFVTSEPFDAVQFYQYSTSISLGNVTLNNFVLTKFCASDDLGCNVSTNLTNPEHSVYINSQRTGSSGIACANCTVDNANDILDNDPLTYASMNMLLSAGSTLGLSVKDAMRSYPIGTYAGFDIVTASLLDVNLLSGIRIETYLNDELSQEYTGASLVSLGSSFIGGTTTSKLAFLATAPFDEIRLVLIGSVAGNVGETRVYNAFVTRLCDENPLECNVPSTLGFPEHPVVINSINTNITAVGCVGCSLDDVNAIIDGDLNTSAKISVTGGIATTARVSIMRAVNPFAANTFVGIPVEMQSIANLDIFNNIQLIAYRSGTEVARADASSSSLLSLSSGGIFPTDRQTLGIVPTVEFDEVVVEITIPVSVNAGILELYDVVAQKFCNEPINCDETIYLNQGDAGMPVYINYGRTGSSGVACAGCTVTDADAAISSDVSDFAILNVVAGVGAATSLSVVDAMNVYPFGTYVGFTVEAPIGFAQAELFSGITLQTYLDGVFQESRTSVSLIDLGLLGVPIFSPGTGIYNVGFKVTKDFDEVRIISGEIAGAGVLDGLKVYGAWVDTRESNGGNLYCHKQVNPDMNVVLQNYTITGNLKTNDILPANAVFSDWIADPNNPTGAIVNTSPNGDYTFTSATLGDYYFTYNVCMGEDLCYSTFVKITVKTDEVNPDLVYNVITNPDYANVLSGRSATVKVLLNDAAGNDLLSLVPSTLRVSTDPAISAKFGTAIVNPDATITYTPNPGFIGVDSVLYFISDNNTPSANENSTWVVFNVFPSDYINTVAANNDFKVTKYAVTGNLLENDQDPEGDGILLTNNQDQRRANTANRKVNRVAAKTVNAPEGVLEIEDDGTYTFTPASGFKGTYQYVYDIIDDNVDPSENSATLTIVVTDSYTLPIIIESFNANRNNGVNVLTWKTSLEENASHFSIERSFDGNSFAEIGKVSATNADSYTFEDAIQHSGKLYYRLKLVDLDNTFKYSSIKILEQSSSINLSVFPNPAINGKTYLNTGIYNGMLTVMIMDASGKKVAQNQMMVSSNATVPLPILPSIKGIYYIVVLDKDGNRILQTKIVY